MAGSFESEYQTYINYMATTGVIYLGICLLVVANVGTSVIGSRRTHICSGTKVRCFWLNDIVKRRGALPRHGHLESYSEPDLYCSEGVVKMTIAGLEKAWSGLEVSLFNAPLDSVDVVVTNSSQSLLNGDIIGRCDPGRDGHCTVVLSPYDTVCVGVIVKESYIEPVTYSLDVKSKVLLRFPILMGIGVALIFSAYHLSRSVALYYGGGVTIGILASVIILLYVFSKFVPKKNILGLGIFAGGWALFASVLYWFMDYVTETVVTYWQYVAVYTIIAGVVSFAVLYRMGPISNKRTFDLIQWSIQIIGLCCIYHSTQMRELSLAVCGVTLLFYLIPFRYNPVMLPFLLLYRLLYCVFYPLIVCLRCLSFLNPLNWFRAAPCRRFLTMEEYEEQGHVETRKALADLKKYCQELPTREAVNLMSKLKDTNRFTNFLNGRDHITMEEQVDHDWTFIESSDETDDDSDDRESSRYSLDSSPVRHHTPPHSSRTPPHSSRTPPHSPHTPHHSHRLSNTSPRSRTHYHTVY